MQKGAQQLDLCLQLSQPEVNDLVIQNRLFEDLPLSGVINGLLDNFLHHRQDLKKQEIQHYQVMSPV